MHAGSTPARTKARTPHLVRLRVHDEAIEPREDRWVIAQIAEARGLKTVDERAAFFGVNPTTYRRLVLEQINPGYEFIAAALGSHPDDPEFTFDNLFEVVTP